MNTGGTQPTPERLAAYADGELYGPDRAAVEAWLDTSPQARAEVDALRRLAYQCRLSAAPEPAPDAWDAVLNKLHAAIPSGPVPRRLPVRRRWPVVPAVGAAAAVLAGLWVGQSFFPDKHPNTRATPALNGPMRLVDSREVDIISIDGDDTRSLLVGRPPLRDALQLAGPGDVTVVRIESAPFLRFEGPIALPADADDAP